ncbi:MAG: FAD-binding oxidoreductase [Bacteroidota bacterium]
MSQKRKFWGWGYEDFPLSPGMLENYTHMLKFSLGIKEFEDIPEPQIGELNLNEPRFSLPAELGEICSSDPFDRASHTYGKSFRDVWRGLMGRFEHAPDYVAFPKTETEILALMRFCAAENISLIPFGGGSSVVGGVEPSKTDKYKGTISLDMKHFDQILEIDKASRSVRVQAGIFGPALEQGLKAHGLSLRHYPQSFEFSTAGGWIVTRSGGHFATLYTHIDEFVQSVRMVSPSGIMQTRKLPGSGAGPSEERLVCGSEGIFGVVTEAWLRVQDIPTFKEAQTVSFDSFEKGVEACRQIAQSGLNPSNARLVSPLEALSNGLGKGNDTVLILGFESHDHELGKWMERALEICKGLGGYWKVKEKKAEAPRDKAADAWKKSFLQAPYMRDELIKKGMVVETFETAVTWDQFDAFHKGVESATLAALKEHCGGGIVTVRFTHLYPDGPAPYYTVIAKGEKGRQLEQWDKIKKAASDAIIKYGGTITHHHAVGKDHQPFYEKQHSAAFKTVLKNVKKGFDPAGILNPGVLLREEDLE